MRPSQLDFYRRLAHALALQFGRGCEVVVHDLEAEDPEHSIVAIENGEVTGRSVGDGPSHVVLEALHDEGRAAHDRLAYLTRTPDGKLLKSSTVFIRDDDSRPVGILSINFDITLLRAAQSSISELLGTEPDADGEPEPIVRNVADLLDDLIAQSERLVGTPAALMTRDEKIRAIGYLDDAGALLVTKAGPKICRYFGISKYTLYSYLDEARASADADGAAPREDDGKREGDAGRA